MPWSVIAEKISACLGRNFKPTARGRVGGGCIDQAWWLADDYSRFFVKLSAAPDAAARHAAECDGLFALARCPRLRVPEPVCRGEAEGHAFLVLEWLDLEPVHDGRALAEALAALHDIEGPRYGWPRDNFLGRSVQINGETDDWCAFFRERRLRPQLAALPAPLAARLRPLGEALAERLDVLLGEHRPPPALVHGDLWAGNVAAHRGRIVLFDPAVHHADPETDLAMAALFGPFPDGFFQTYAALRPPPPGAELRRTLYQLYHLLNHVNLFGAAYLPLAERALARLWSVCR